MTFTHVEEWQRRLNDLTKFKQTMTPEQAENFRYNIFDLTKIWPHTEYPLRPIGKLVLNENPQNYFAEIEQVHLTHVVD